MSNTSNEQLNNSEKALLALLKKALFGIECNLSNKEKIDAYNESKNQSVRSLVGDTIELVGPEYKYISNDVMSCIGQSIKIHRNHKILHEIISKYGIPYTVIKGATNSVFYEKPLHRMMGDVDFLIHETDIDRATKVLINEGFTKSKNEHICHIVFRKEDIKLEMHFQVAGIPEGEVGDRIKEYLSDTIEKASLYKTDIDEFMNPSKFHHGLIILLHMQHHLLSEGIGLRHLCDWAMFVNSMTNEEFVELFKNKLEEVGLWKFAQTVSLAANIGLGLPYKEFMGQDNELANNILIDIIKGGDLGNKDKERRRDEGQFISNRGKDGTSNNRIVEFVKTTNVLINTRMSITKKYKVLLPFGWCYYIVRSGVRVIQGKRAPLKFTKAFVNSKQRKSMYSELNLFKNEKR